MAHSSTVHEHSLTSPGQNRVRRIEKGFEIFFIICASVSTIAVAVITIYMLSSGGPAVMEVGLWDFLFGTNWAPTATNPQYGILPMILASIFGTLGAIAIGVPVGLLAAVYLAKMAGKKVGPLLRTAVELLAGIPSVIYGFIGMIIVAPVVAAIFNLPIGSNLFSAMLILSVMILPTIITISENAIRAVPQSLDEASLALGATQMQTIFKITIPAARSGIITSIVLGVGRAIGETMAVIMVAGNVVNMPKLFESVRFMTTGIVLEMSYADEFHKSVLFAIGLTLFVFIMLLNVGLHCFMKKENGKYE